MKQNQLGQQCAAVPLCSSLNGRRCVEEKRTRCGVARGKINFNLQISRRPAVVALKEKDNGWQFVHQSGPIEKKKQIDAMMNIQTRQCHLMADWPVHSPALYVGEHEP